MMQFREGERRQEKGMNTGEGRRREKEDKRMRWRLVKEEKREGRRRDNGAGSMTEKETKEGVLGAD